jgi:hypothetical protein
MGCRSGFTPDFDGRADVRTCERAKVRKCESAGREGLIELAEANVASVPQCQGRQTPLEGNLYILRPATQQGVPKYDLPPPTLAQSETPKVRSKSGAHFQWMSQPPKAGFRYVEMPFGLQVSQLSLKDTTMTGTGPLNLQSMERGVLIDI